METMNALMGPCVVLGNEGIVMSIPNSQVVYQRAQNLSQADTCQAKQTLWLKNGGIENVMLAVETIKDNIFFPLVPLSTEQGPSASTLAALKIAIYK
jgi:hypothetical protein